MKKILEYYEKDGDMEQVAETYSYLRFYYFTLNDDYKKSIKNYNTSLELYQELQDTVKIAEQFSNLAWVNEMHGYDTDNIKYFLESIDYSQTALEIYVLINDSLHFAEEAEKIGNIHSSNLSNYTKAIEFYTRSIEIMEKIGEQEIPNMHPVDVGVCRDHNTVITKTLHTLFDTKGAHDIVELFVLVDRVALLRGTIAEELEPESVAQSCTTNDKEKYNIVGISERKITAMRDHGIYGSEE